MSNSGAAHMLELSLSWLECQQEATVDNTTVLRGLHAIAAKNEWTQLSKLKLLNFFH